MGVQHLSEIKMEFLRPVEAAFANSSKLDIECGQSELESWGIQNVKLRSYQLDGVKWLVERYKMNQGCILGDEMGLGKTLQVKINNHCM